MHEPAKATYSLMGVVIETACVFGVEIDACETVSQLKHAVTAQLLSMVACDADALALFLARRDGEWLKSTDPAIERLGNGEVSSLITVMTARALRLDVTLRVGNALFAFPRKGTDGGGRPASRHHPVRQRRLAELVAIYERKIAELREREAESSPQEELSLEDVDRGMPPKPYQQPTRPMPAAALNALHAHLTLATHALGPLEEADDAARLHLVFPFLATVCGVAGGDARVVANVRLRGDCVRADAFFDFVVCCGKTRVCVLLARRGALRQALARASIGCEVVAVVHDVVHVYGVVTDSMTWHFHRSLRDAVERGSFVIKRSRDAMQRVAESLYAMLSVDE